MDDAVQPTQLLSLVEDAFALSSFIRVVKILNIDVRGATPTEADVALMQMKQKIEQQFAFNTNTGMTQSFVNPQSPNNFLYLRKNSDGSDMISVTDLEMNQTTEADMAWLDYLLNKKLSSMQGIPKEALNFSSNEGLGSAGNVLAQKSSLFAAAVDGSQLAYMRGITSGLNMFYKARGLSGMIDAFGLDMNPVITTRSTIQSDRRDAAISQAASMVDLLTSLGVNNADSFKDAIIEVLAEVIPNTASNIKSMNMDIGAGAMGAEDTL